MKKNHGVFTNTLSKEANKELLSPFKNIRPIEGYKDRHQGDELLARMGQFKNYLGFKGNENFTKQHLNFIRENYTKDMIDNGITNLLNKIPKNSNSEKKFIENMNKFAFSTVPIGAGIGVSQNKQGGEIQKQTPLQRIKEKFLNN